MSIADKLTAIAENQQKVYDAGKAAALTANWAPIYITAQPQGYTGPADSRDIYITVEALGEGLTYLWQQSSDGGTTWSTYGGTGYDTKTMTTAAYSSRMGNMYRCRVLDENSNRVFTQAALLTEQTDTTTAEEE